MERREVSFISGGEQIAAWEYAAGTEGTVPAVVMAHGLGGVRDAGLDPFARRFADAGMRVLVFDYRHFGASTGEPRQLLDIDRQLDDFRAAFAHARALDGVDPDRVAIWGFSFGGGHAVTLAAEDRRIAAAVAMCPMADGLSALRAFSPRRLVASMLAALRDESRRLRGRPPHYIPLVGPAEATAALTTDDAMTGYIGNLVPEVTTWRNRYTPRLNLRFPFYRAVRRAGGIACPIHVTVCDRDTVTFPEPAARVADLAPRGEARRYDSDHYEIWVGELFERAVADQTEFLRRNLQLA
jgi:pimeloyl-ACP methyl ester carboxylesterase